jgi:hypothetical protein
LGLLATVTIEVDPFRAYAPFLELLPFFKCILEAVFCEGVQDRLRFCLDRLSCVKMMAFQFYLQLGEQRRVGREGNESNFLSGQEFPGGNGSARRCVVVMKQPVFLSPKFATKSSYIFTQSPLNVTVVCGIDCLVFQNEFFVNNPLDEKKMMSMPLTLLFTRLDLFALWEFGISMYGSTFFPERLSNRSQGPRRTFPEICIKLGVSLLDPS